MDSMRVQQIRTAYLEARKTINEQNQLIARLRALCSHDHPHEYVGTVPTCTVCGQENP